MSKQAALITCYVGPAAQLTQTLKARAEKAQARLNVAMLVVLLGSLGCQAARRQEADNIKGRAADAEMQSAREAQRRAATLPR